MKRHGGLWPSIIAFGNLLRAAYRARLGKRFRDDVLDFNFHLEENLIALREELVERMYRPGPYRTFLIHEPKRRLISAAPYRDRVAHHALCNVIEPIFDATFIHTCYANRREKGTHKALAHFAALARKHAFCLRADIEKYFPSIDHAILKAIIRKKIKCRETLWLIERILDNSNPQEPVNQWFAGDDLLVPAQRRHGLPIGNLTSQLWANVYLNAVDHAMAHQFGGSRYIRYVDDFALFSDSKEELRDALDLLRELLAPLRLRLHPAKTGVLAVRGGVNFLGFRVFPDRLRIRQDNLKRARRRFRGLVASYRDGEIGFSEAMQSLRSWNAHAEQGDTWRLREQVFDSLVFARG